MLLEQSFNQSRDVTPKKKESFNIYNIEHIFPYNPLPFGIRDFCVPVSYIDRSP